MYPRVASNVSNTGNKLDGKLASARRNVKRNCAGSSGNTGAGKRGAVCNPSGGTGSVRNCRHCPTSAITSMSFANNGCHASGTTSVSAAPRLPAIQRALS
ncbi:hypothetical protein LZZ50_08300 [Xanthomonas arboricola]|uniref:hypothetical protein n=1 Tax=Xanthomonas arboricola TaxID=56448 RepID=UPI001FD6F426|nr:hypothetical protein [Xanthomonas arboricola]UOT00312.1 hypothetical protein LZZ50_08300 [Xanthomonas arboricola]